MAFSAPHAHLIEGGRKRAGPITPKRRRALRIGDAIRSRSRYKRTRGMHFLAGAIEETKETMVEELAKVLRHKLEQKLPSK